MSYKLKLAKKMLQSMDRLSVNVSVWIFSHVTSWLDYRQILKILVLIYMSEMHSIFFDITDVTSVGPLHGISVSLNVVLPGSRIALWCRTRASTRLAFPVLPNPLGGTSLAPAFLCTRHGGVWLISITARALAVLRISQTGSPHMLGYTLPHAFAAFSLL